MCVEANPTELDRIHAFSVKWQYVMMVEKETIINLVVYFKQEREMKVMHGANEHKQTERNRETESEVREIRRQRERNRETEREVREIR